MSGKNPLVFLILALALPLAALEPPTREELERYQRDGSLARRRLNALALGNHLVDPWLAREFRQRLGPPMKSAGVALPDRAAAPAGFPPGTRNTLPSKGSVKVFAVLIDFPDHPAVNGADAIREKLFGNGAGDYPRESLRNFYRRSSYDLLDIGGTVLGWYRPAYARASMAQTTSAREALIKEALLAFDAAGHDFAQYDNDGNGTVDYFLVLWSGPDNGWANFWWGYQTSYGGSGLTLDGKSFLTTRYSWQWESRPVGQPFWPYVVIHETGHALGLPDFYDYDGSIGPKGGLGGMDMMDANRCDHNAFSKMLLDWIRPRVFNCGTQTFALEATALAPDALVVMPEFSAYRLGTNDPFDEFFLVQNRVRAGNDSALLPTNGLLIWHVDARLNSAGTAFQYNNSYSSHKLLRLMEADGLEEIERSLAADADDFYVPGRTFGPATVPDSRRYDGTDPGVAVYDLGPPGTSMTLTADIHYTLFPVRDPSITRLASVRGGLPGPVNRIAWTPDPRNRTPISRHRVLARLQGAASSGFVVLGTVPGDALHYDHAVIGPDWVYVYWIISEDRNGAASDPAEVGG